MRARRLVRGRNGTAIARMGGHKGGKHEADPPLGIIPRHAVDFGAATIRSHDVVLEVLHPIVPALNGGHVFECVVLTGKDGAVFDNVFNLGPLVGWLISLQRVWSCHERQGPVLP